VSAIVFVGPSLHGRSFVPRPDIALRPPAAQGDIYRACLLQPRVIGLIDGVFEGVPSVWHKEILWALSHGIAVFGSASMGALRAAELDAYGMTGLGAVYEWYRSGLIEDDEEVALLHGPAEAGYLPLSVPTVNVRASCAAAVEARIIDEAAAGVVLRAARSLHYKDRGWRDILEQAGATGLEADLCERLRTWLDEARVDQKQRDAMTLIEAVAAKLESPGEPQPANFRFEWTDLWEQAKRQWDGEEAPPDTPATLANAVMDELRLDPDTYVSIRSQAVARAAVLAGAVARPDEVDDAAKRRRLARLREALGLMRRSDLDAWVARNELDGQSLEALLEAEVRLDTARRLPQALIERQILALLHLNDSYAGLAARARDKRRVLASTAFGEDGLPQRVTVPALLDWYFRARLAQPVPDSFEGLIEDLDLASRKAFYRLVAAEYVYCATQRGG
jgi:hypothetical protein